MQIYISHAQSDRELARSLAEQLKVAGVRIWDPYAEIFPGDNFARAIGQALEESEIMVVLYTKAATHESMMQQEVQYALTSGNYRGRVVPVVVDRVTFEAGADVPWVILKLDPIYVQGKNPDFSPVVKRVQKLVEDSYHAAN